MIDDKHLGQIERWLMEACQQLNLPVEGIDDDFFEVGGTSLALVRLVARVENEYGADVLTAEELIENSTMREIAMCIQRNTADDVHTVARND
jgi:acyl carrier protein